MSTVAMPQVVHSLPGRVRVHLPGEPPIEEAALEQRLGSVAGVRKVRANARTRNVLIEYDRARLDEAQILRRLGWTAPKTQSRATPASEHQSRSRARAGRDALVTHRSARRARIAVHGLDRDPGLGRRLVDRLDRMDEVQKVSPSPLTGRVLVEFADVVEDIQPVLDALAELEPPADDTEPEIPPHPLDPGPIIEGASKLAGAAIGLGLLMARRAAGANEAPVARAGPGEVAGALALLETEAGIADRIEAAIGHRNKEIAFGLVGIVSMTSAGSALGLLFAAALALPLLREAQARRAGWHEYQRRLSNSPPAYPGAVLTLTPGQRSPLPGVVRDGFAVTAALDGVPQPLAPGLELTSGSRVYGGMVTVELHANGRFEPRPRPAPVPATFYDRYLKAVPYAALAYAGAAMLATRSPARALGALLLVNPRPALAGRESADRFASARAMRAGVTVAGSRAERPIVRPGVLVIDQPRTVTDGWEVRAIGVAAEHSERESEEVAGAISDASGSPWGALRRGRLTAEDGTFDGRVASAELNGDRWLLEPANDAPSLVRPEPGDFILRLRRQRDHDIAAEVALRPRLARGLGVLMDRCAARGVELEIASASDTPAARRLAERADLRLRVGNTADRVRELQSQNMLVAVLGDGAHTAAAFDASDMAIGLSSGVSGRFAARADLLAPGLEAVGAVIEAGARRDMAVRDGTAIAVLSGAGGATWGTLRTVPFKLCTRPDQLGGVAAISAGLARLSGGRPARTVMERLSDPQPERWGREGVDEVLAQLGSRPRGLTSEEVRARRQALPHEAEERGLIGLMAEQVKSPLVAVLAAGAGLSLALGALGDVAMIGAVVVANAFVGAWEEGRAGEATRALREMSARRARVLRDGVEQVLPADELVRGDVIVLASGDRIAADARLLTSDALEVDEASLTGESMPVPKSADNGGAASRIVLDGTDVTTGTARAVVVAVGGDTRMGAIAAALADSGDRQTPLDARLGRILWRALPLIALGGGIVTLAGVLRGQAALQQLTLGASVAIAAVPEGLPLLAGVASAAVARRLAQRRALVTRLGAVEALGRVDVACIDKTGTITTGRPAVTLVVTAAGTRGSPPELDPELAEVLLTAAKASPSPEATDVDAHPTDTAVVDAAQLSGLAEDLPPRDAEARFEPTRGFHATLADRRLYVKGAVEVLEPRCSRVRLDGDDRPLTNSDRARLTARAERLAREGLRVLLVAETRAEVPADEPAELTALGFVCISDPLRPTAAAAIARCREAGVRVVMITGDHPATAEAIAHEVGLPHGPERLLTGAEIASLDDDELRQRLERATVIARSTPLDKLRIVEVLRSAGHVVAMTGDGVNDAPALRLADVGVAMGSGGTEVAREAADLVVTDDDFSTLAEALVEGRAFWKNLRRALGLLLGGNAGEVTLMTAAGVAGLPSPLTTRQVLTVNLVTDVLPAVSVAVQPPEHRNLADLRREGGVALDAPLRNDIVKRALATGAPSVVAYVAASRRMPPAAARSVAYVSIVGTQLAQTVELGWAEGRLTSSVLAAVGGSVAVLAATVTVPWLRGFLGFGALPAYGLALAGAASLAAPALSHALPVERFLRSAGSQPASRRMRLSEAAA